MQFTDRKLFIKDRTKCMDRKLNSRTVTVRVYWTTLIYKVLGKILTFLGLFFDNDIWRRVIKTWIQCNVMKSAQDDKALSAANDVINLIFKMAPRLIERVHNTERLLSLLLLIQRFRDETELARPEEPRVHIFREERDKQSQQYRLTLITQYCQHS